MSLTRRDVGMMALSALAAPSLFSRPLFARQTGSARIHGVLVGSQTYSFRALQADPMSIVAAFRTIGIHLAELMSNHAEGLAGIPPLPPAGGRGETATPEQQAALKAAQAAQAKWRQSTSPATWAAVRKIWNDAGVEVRFLTYNMGGNTTDESIEYAMQMAKGLGVRAITTSTTVSMTKRIAPIAEKHGVIVAVHGHSDVKNPEQISTEETFLRCFEASKNIWANLDIGHYAATGANPVEFLQKHHARITNLHIKDRMTLAKGGANVPFGQGETPIRDVLQLLKKNPAWDIAANVEFEYTPNEPLTEMPRCMDYIRQALA